ncbi:antitoxin VbhA family protein [Salmonella enterica]
MLRNLFQNRALRKKNVESALSEVRLEGLNVSDEALRDFDELVKGNLTTEEITARITARYSENDQ